MVIAIDNSPCMVGVDVGEVVGGTPAVGAGVVAAVGVSVGAGVGAAVGPGHPN